MFIDVHCHVYGEKLDELLANARKANVKVIVNSGANIRANRKTLKLSKKYPEFKATMGLYPGDALKLRDDKIDKEIAFIRKNKEKIIAISEVGMDFKEETNREQQEKNFSKFIEVAKELDKPLIVHSRKAEKECIELLEKLEAKKVIMHCFSGNMKLVAHIVQSGWFLSIPASVKTSLHFQEVIKRAPIEQLLCETDSPYLHPDKQFPNEPANVLESYKAIARIKNLSLNQTEKKIEKNFRNLFE